MKHDGNNTIDAVFMTFQERLSACLEEERQRGREMTDTALQDARVEREAYVQQQRQVRTRRHTWKRMVQHLCLELLNVDSSVWEFA